MPRGKFIVLEGGEGAGKSVQIGRMRELSTPGTIFTRDPGGVETGEDIRRENLLNKMSKIPICQRCSLIDLLVD